ncbi:MAG: hypothetical protein HPY45_11570 [Anaerolineae bacterium]|nr:hypothetical protein [Anaerolineae bacterium]
MKLECEHKNLLPLILVVASILLSCRVSVRANVSPVKTAIARFMPVQQTPVPDASLAAPGEACFGSAFGLTCLGQSGWRMQTSQDSALRSDRIFDLAFCPDQRLVVSHALGVDVSGVEGWQPADDESMGIPVGVLCDFQNRLWLAYEDRIELLQAKDRVVFDREEVAADQPLFVDLTATSAGDIWVLTPQCVARYDGKKWQENCIDRQQGTPVFLKAFAAGKGHQIWVAHDAGILRFENGKWQAFRAPLSGTLRDIAVDISGHVWLSMAGRLLMFDPDTADWIDFSAGERSPGVGVVNALAADGQGRVWVGGEWGLAILDGERWTSYRMDTAALADNALSSIAVMGGGPALPAALSMPMGAISGRIIEADLPLGGVAVELCAGYLDSVFYGETPCADKPLRKRVVTARDGRFVFTDLPAGRYYILVQDNQGVWAWLEMTDGAARPVLVRAGEETALGDLLIR